MINAIYIHRDLLTQIQTTLSIAIRYDITETVVYILIINYYYHINVSFLRNIYTFPLPFARW